MKPILIIVVLIIYSTLPLHTQSLEQRQFQLAQSYENNGKFEDASRLYFELLQKNPSNNEYLKSWYRVTKQLNRYSEILEYLQNRIKNYNDFTTNLLIAEAYWLKGMPNEANSAWKTAQSFARTKEDFGQIAESMASLRQYQKAIQVYKDGRKKINMNSIFSNELFKLYVATGNYVEAIDETIMNFLIVGGQINVAQGRLYTLMINDEVKSYLADRLEKEYQKNKNTKFANLLIWFYQTTDNYEKAFELTLELDKASNANFTEILKFANQVRSDGQFSYALKAYSYIIENADKTNPVVPSALYGYANALEQQLLVDENTQKKQLEQVKNVYLKIIKDYPNTPQQFEGYFRLAQISYEIDNNPQEAIDYLQKIDERFGINEFYIAAKSELSKMYLIFQYFDKAIANYANILTKIPKSAHEMYQEQINNVNFQIAKIYYYQGKIDSTKLFLDKIQLNSSSPIANDYLFFYNFINSYENLNAAIRSYAQGEYYEMIKDYKKAIENYQNAAKFAAGSELEELAILNIAEINHLQGNFDNSIQIYDQFIDKFPNSVYLDEVYLRIGKIYQQQGKLDLAETTLTKILVYFPKSIYYEEARKLIRELRATKTQ